MKILGIDTSCDDTCVAVLKIEPPTKNWWRGKFLSNVVSSQVKLHAKYGGVWPFLAKREHQRNLPIVFNKALRKAGFVNPKSQISKLDLIAVTVGPGLEPCLWQGINFAKVLSHNWKKPIIPINHIEAHILINFLNLKSKTLNLKSIFPAICLVVSGGHTQLILMEKIGRYRILGETRDDAAGECFDKTARILGLGYPGGPAIAQIANKNGREQFSTRLPRPMIGQKNYDFSFAGLKTAVLYDFKSQPPEIRKSKEYIRAMAREIQQAVIDVLIQKTLKAARDFGIKSIILGGGVASNEELRKQFKTACLKCHLKHFLPPKNLCTDNGAMIALTAFFHREKETKDWQKIKANANLKIG